MAHSQHTNADEWRDTSTDVIDILASHVIPLHLGYVPIVNRGQCDIDTSKPIQQVLDAKRHLFDSHPTYQGKAQDYGTPVLACKLNMVCTAFSTNDCSINATCLVDLDASH